MGERWSQPGGYGELLRIAAPLILSTASWSIQAFVDQMFLAWYSREAVAAALPAAILWYTFASFFAATGGYVNTFVAQYSGAKRPDRVGPSVWQGIYFSLFAAVFMLALIPFAEGIFELAGHDPTVRPLETVYFKILCFAGITVMGGPLGAFFTGRGDTRTIMWVNICAVSLNVVLDYGLIFGAWGFPEWGIRGAAWATVAAHTASMVTLTVLMLRRRFRDRYNTLRGWRPDRELFRRLLRFGMPSGVEHVLTMLGLSLFVLLVGRLGQTELAATNIVMNIGWMAFLPMIGLTVAVSTMVGRYLGEDQPDVAERTVWCGFRLVTLYGGAVALVYILIPEIILSPFAARADPESFAAVREIGIVLLKFLAAFTVFDYACLTFSSGIKGAGDTRFVMWVFTALTWTIMVFPTYLACVVFDWGIYVAWAFHTLFVIVAGSVFLFRFRGGKWKTMRVIEAEASPEAIPPPPVPDRGLDGGPPGLDV